MDQKTCYLQNLEEIQKTGKKFVIPLATLTSVKSSQKKTHSLSYFQRVKITCYFILLYFIVKLASNK